MPHGVERCGRDPQTPSGPTLYFSKGALPVCSSVSSNPMRRGGLESNRAIIPKFRFCTEEVRVWPEIIRLMLPFSNRTPRLKTQ